MLRTRLWMGALLITMAAGILLVDHWLAPWFPFLLATSLAATSLGTRELLALLHHGVPPEQQPRPLVAYSGVAALVLACWPPNVGLAGSAAEWVLLTLAAVFMGTFLVEASRFEGPGGAVARIALGSLVIGYLGILASFLLSLRWLPGWKGSLAVALAIFVPKCCDIGAYFTGRALGRHRLTPVLSPKKTWEGAAGGLVLAAVAAVAIDALGHVAGGLVLGFFSAVGFGLAVGLWGMLGDLMESLIKRDCQQKDASAIMPGFGGVLDVLDSILFSAPVSYWWIRAFGI